MAAADVAIIMGSQSDWPTMKHAADTLDQLGISYDARIVSAHRTPDRMYEFAKGAKAEGFKVIIAGAGGADAYPILGVEARVDDAVHVQVQVVELGSVRVGRARVHGARRAVRLPRFILDHVFDDEGVLLR